VRTALHGNLRCWCWWWPCTTLDDAPSLAILTVTRRQKQCSRHRKPCIPAEYSVTENFIVGNGDSSPTPKIFWKIYLSLCMFLFFGALCVRWRYTSIYFSKLCMLIENLLTIASDMLCKSFFDQKHSCMSYRVHG